MLQKLEKYKISEGSSTPKISFKNQIQEENYKVIVVKPSQNNLNF